MLGRKWSVVGLSALGMTALALNACGGSSSDDTSATPGGGGGSAGSGGASAPDKVEGKVPPKVDAAAPAGDGSTVIVAMNKIDIGDAKDAWKTLGYNIDGLKFKTADASGHCKPEAGAKPGDVIIDGTDGVDNSFAHNIIPIITGLASDAPQKVQEAITDGSFSVLLRIQKLGTGAKYKDLGGELFAAAGQKDAMGNTVAPAASGDWSSYEWQPFPELLDGDKTGSGDALKSKVTFPSSYVVDNTWVSGSKGVVTLNLSLSGYDLKLTINQAVVSATFAGDRKSADKGVISGVLGTAELTDGIKKIAGTISSGLCSGSALQGVLDQIKQASDIGADGTQTEGKTCDGISIGLGFGATVSKIGKAAPASVPKDACAGM